MYERGLGSRVSEFGGLGVEDLGIEGLRVLGFMARG